MLCRGWCGQRPCPTMWSSAIMLLLYLQCGLKLAVPFIFSTAFQLPKLFENGFVACFKHFLCLEIFYQMVYCCLIEYFLAGVCIIKCFTNGSRHFQRFLMFEDEHMFCLWKHPCLQLQSFCTSGSNMMTLTWLFRERLGWPIRWGEQLLIPFLCCRAWLLFGLNGILNGASCISHHRYNFYLGYFCSNAVMLHLNDSCVLIIYHTKCFWSRQFSKWMNRVINTLRFNL